MNKEDFKKFVKLKNLRISIPRLLIYQVLSNAKHPLTAQEIYGLILKDKKKVGLTSIYRTLDLFEAIGIVFKLVTNSTVKYLLCKSSNHHHHLICKACGEVIELELCDLSELIKKIMELTNYNVTDHQLSFFGYCKSCKA
jgi:Fur family ferric uptake transcriptional regulator